MSLYQQTVAKTFQITGVGLHSALPATVRVKDAPANHGIVFRRSDLPASTPSVRASVHNVHQTLLSTTLKDQSISVSTIEHLMAALWGAGIDNAVVEVDGPEIPILDGSSLPFLQALESVGRKELSQFKKYHYVQAPVFVQSQDRWIRVEPCERLVIDCTIDFSGTMIGKQSFCFDSQNDTFDLVASARTFCKLADVEAMRSKGLALGGSLDNAIVVSESGVLNPEGLRHPNEFVCHKILDFIGDMALTGLNLVGHFQLMKPGHGINASMAQELVSRRQSVLRVGPYPLSAARPNESSSTKVAASLLGGLTFSTR